MKTSAKKSFLLCFRPINVMENRAPTKSKSTNNLSRRDLDFNLVKHKDESMISDDRFTKLKKVSSDDRFLKFNKASSDKESNRRRSSRTKSARRILKNMAKAVFGTSLSKKGRNGKVVQDPLRSDSSISAKSEKISILTEAKSGRKQSEEDEEDKWKKIKPTISSSDLSSSATLTSSSSLLSSSSTSSSCSSSWRAVPESRSSWISFSGRDKSFRLDHDKKQINNKTRSSNYSCITGLMLLLFSLSVLVFWGKICSILCTSTWFYFVSTSRRGSEEEDDESPLMIKSPEEELQSKEKKKKVIMEGFLERNNPHHHRLLNQQ